jgi:hypothetical protein
VAAKKVRKLVLRPVGVEKLIPASNVALPIQVHDMAGGRLDNDSVRPLRSASTAPGLPEFSELCYTEFPARSLGRGGVNWRTQQFTRARSWK